MVPQVFAFRANCDQGKRSEDFGSEEAKEGGASHKKIKAACQSRPASAHHDHWNPCQNRTRFRMPIPSPGCSPGRTPGVRVAPKPVAKPGQLVGHYKGNPQTVLRCLEERWSRKFGPAFKVDRMMKVTIRNEETQEPFARF